MSKIEKSPLASSAVHAFSDLIARGTAPAQAVLELRLMDKMAAAITQNGVFVPQGYEEGLECPHATDVFNWQAADGFVLRASYFEQFGNDPAYIRNVRVVQEQAGAPALHVLSVSDVLVDVSSQLCSRNPVIRPRITQCEVTENTQLLRAFESVLAGRPVAAVQKAKPTVRNLFPSGS